MKSLFSLVALMLLLNVATADVRTWTSRDGKTRFEAEIVGLAKDTDRVIMRKPDGTLVRVAIAFFSFDDQKHIKSLVPTLKRNVPFVNEKPNDAAGIEAALKRPADVSIRQSQLEEAVDYLQSRFKVPIYIDRQALKKGRFDNSQRISVEGKDKPLKDALNAICEPRRLAWIVRHDVIVVTSPDVAEHELFAKVYQLTKPTRPERLVGAVTAKIEPDSWQSQGGSGTIQPLGRAIVVRHNYRVHAAIAEQMRDVLTPVVLEKKPGPAALDEVVEFSFGLTPLQQIADKLAGDTHVPVRIDWDRLSEFGVDELNEYAMFIENVSARSALHLLANAVDPEAIVVLSDKDVIITARGQPVARAFDVREIVGRGGVQQVAELIATCAAPQSWTAAGGSGQLRTRLPATIQVLQTRDVIREIATLLTLLRQANG